MDDVLVTPEMRQAEQDLASKLTVLFDDMPLIPSTPIQSIDNAEYAEDNETFIVNATLTDGTVLYVSLKPGRPLGVSVHDVGERV